MEGVGGVAAVAGRVGQRPDDVEESPTEPGQPWVAAAAARQDAARARADRGRGVPQDFRTIRTFAEQANHIVRYTEFDRGGHFAYTTDPDLVVADLREFFGGLG